MITAFLNNLKFIIIGILAIMAIVIAFKFPSLRTAVAILASVMFVFCSCIAINRVVTYYTVSGKTYGTVDSVFKNNQVDFEKTDDYTFEFRNFGLQSTTITNQYQARATDTHKIEIDLSNNDWALFVNGTLLSNLQNTKSTLTGDLFYIFYDTNDTVIKADALTISVAFEEKTTEIVLTTNGGDIAVNLWNTYLNKNGFKLKLKKVESRTPNNTIKVDEEPTEAQAKSNSYTQNEFDSTNLQFDFYINRNLYNKYKFSNKVNMAFKNNSLGIGGVAGELTNYSLLDFTLEYIDETNEYYHFRCSATNYNYNHFMLNFILTATENYTNSDFYAYFSIGGKKSLDKAQYSFYLNECNFDSECNFIKLLDL